MPKYQLSNLCLVTPDVNPSGEPGVWKGHSMLYGEEQGFLTQWVSHISLW